MHDGTITELTPRAPGYELGSRLPPCHQCIQAKTWWKICIAGIAQDSF